MIRIGSSLASQILMFLYMLFLQYIHTNIVPIIPLNKKTAPIIYPLDNGGCFIGAIKKGTNNPSKTFLK